MRETEAKGHRGARGKHRVRQSPRNRNQPGRQEPLQGPQRRGTGARSNGKRQMCIEKWERGKEQRNKKRPGIWGSGDGWRGQKPLSEDLWQPNLLSISAYVCKGSRRWERSVYH